MPFELWDKQVKPGSAKKGMRKILIASDFNIAGQFTYLMRAINKYSPYRARCVIWHDDHFQFDKDIILGETGQVNKEANQLAHEADFFIFGRYIFNFPGVNFANDGLISRDNTFVRYHGSFLRENGRELRQYHLDNDVVAVAGCDWTATGRLAGCFYHIGSYFNDYSDMCIRDVSYCPSYKPGETFLINAGSAGHPSKGYDFLQETIKKLQKDGHKIELKLYTNLSHEDFMIEKAKCNATFSGLSAGWGASGIEGMWLGQAVLCGVDPWLMTLYPDAPIIPVDKGNLEKELIMLMEDEGKVSKLGWEAREWVSRTFSTKRILKQYLYLIDLIRHRDKYMEGVQELPRLYDL